MSEIQATVKAGFHWWRSQSQSQSRNQKHRAYDPVKTVFRCLPSTYDIVKTRLSESEACRSGRTSPITNGGNVHCDWFILLTLFPTLTIWFSLDHKQNVSARVVIGVERKWKCSDSSDSGSIVLMTALTTLIFDFHKIISALTIAFTTSTPSLVKASLEERRQKVRDCVQWD